MTSLTEQKCVACRPDAPAVTPQEREQLLPQIPQWRLVEREGIPRLERVFRFKNYLDALEFTNRVAAAAEEEGHHPAILLEWGKVTVSWWTHAIRNLHLNDFISAAKTDRIYDQLVAERGGPGSEPVLHEAEG
ncbi:MAG: putative pterin-4-alpha-carbinolamine dehydratase 1 [Dehalococcoidia bacterium]|nr:MAG: putative pterin-4-alpha-carbinolamine dehydratase 1 [Dehalococcoidia bacterium]